MKYIFVTGGVLSGLGKGITAASIGNIMKARGFRIFMQKFDQYLNVDAGTLNPGEHGEVFVTEDGAETDLDLGHYERFIDTNLNKNSSVMTGDIYNTILSQEREGKFLGKTVQVIPHVTDEVKNRIRSAAQSGKAQIHICEVGGTVGDYEGLHFIEGIRQMEQDVGRENVAYVHVGYLPYLEVTDELKTKPIQNSIRSLQSLGIRPDIVVCRADRRVDKKLLNKVAMFAGMNQKSVIGLETLKSVYKVPLILEQNNVGRILSKKLNLPYKNSRHDDWKKLVGQIDKKNRQIKIGLVGKYMTMKDTYISVIEAIKAAAYKRAFYPKIIWIDSEKLEFDKNYVKELSRLAGVVVPGGFGNRGLEGMITAIKYVRENDIPFLGLCLGMQMAVVEYARNVCELKGAHSTEVNPKTKYPVIDILPEQKSIINKGGTMRLGSYPASVKSGSLLEKLYGLLKIHERHRHRYEVNPKFHKILQDNKMIFSGMSPNKKLVEFIELAKDQHCYFIATQAHPEFRSRPNKPHPLFIGLIDAAQKKLDLSQYQRQHQSVKN